MARRAVRTFRRGARRGTDWSASAVATGFGGLAASTAAISQGFVPTVGGETLIRTRGLFSWRSDQLASSEGLVGAVGIAVVTEQAFTVGITAVPHPHTDAAWGGWLWHSYFASQIDVSSAVGFTQDGAHQLVVDSKAMRKVDEDERLVLVVENSAAVGMQFFWAVRLLSKLH